MEKSNGVIPKWEKEIDNFKGIKSTFILEGNISDLYPFMAQDTDSQETVKFCSLNRIIMNLFDSNETKDHYDFLFCDPIFGFSDPLNLNKTVPIVERCEKQIEEEKKVTKELNGTEKKESHSASKAIKISEIIRTAMTKADNQCEESQKKSVAVVVNFASHYLSSAEGLSADDIALFLNLLYASQNAIRGNQFVNTLILVVDKLNDIPAWFYLNNPNVRTIRIAFPDRFIREAYIDMYFKALSGEDEAIKKTKDKFVDLTDGMNIIELGELRRLFGKMNLPVEEIGSVVSIYKYGIKDNPWADVRGRIGEDIKEKIEERVIGQDEAVEKIVRVVKRAVSGLSGMQHSSEDAKPRGILFLAGPTGTGKTEIVKALAEILFSDEKKMIRFDMSEYSAEHSDQKLFGAPPGYVGYDCGGQLTNAVKSNPFSILLFDEIEKAHPSIMDKFLQILEDGRMTDGQGNTVYFSETLIFFTSNVGISQEIVDRDTGRIIGRKNIVEPGEDYCEIQKKVEGAMSNYFKPEVINRIGENIVVFNYISKEASEKIVESKLKKINNNIRKKHGINVCLSEEVKKKIKDLCWQDKPRSHGGRGIINVIEEQYLNPLAEYIFDNYCHSGQLIYVNLNENAKENEGILSFCIGDSNV